MNIFYLSAYPDQCAEMHCDKHVCKMIIEYAQIMSTAHRVLDGEEYYGRTKNGRRIKRWKMNSNLEDILYKASHVNHPSNQWVRASWRNYQWLYVLDETLRSLFLVDLQERDYNDDGPQVDAQKIVIMQGTALNQ